MVNQNYPSFLFITCYFDLEGKSFCLQRLESLIEIYTHTLKRNITKKKERVEVSSIVCIRGQQQQKKERTTQGKWQEYLRTKREKKGDLII